MSQKWVKVSRGGQFRGEGTWEKVFCDISAPSGEMILVDDAYVCRPEDWENLVVSQFLPTFEGENPPEN